MAQHGCNYRTRSAPPRTRAFFLEKNWRHGVLLSRASGAVCVIIGVAMISQPDVLHLLGGLMA